MANILVADDEELARFTIREILEAEGHRVIEATNGAEAIQLFKQMPTDVIITDIIMPEKEGIETIIELKRDYPAVKIIAISGGGEIVRKNFFQAAELFGASVTLEKPFDGGDLLGALERALNATPSKEVLAS